VKREKGEPDGEGKDGGRGGNGKKKRMDDWG